MGICTCCGYSGPMTEYCPSCGFPNKADTGRKELIEHGWRDKDGKFSAVLKDGRFISRDIDTEYSFTNASLMGSPSMMQKINHPDEEFLIYPAEVCYKKDKRNEYGISKLWYGSGTLHMDLCSFENWSLVTVDLQMDDSVIAELIEPEDPVGWTCSKCGKQFQTDDFCSECGEPIDKIVLFSLSRYSSAMPPQNEGVCVFEFSEKELICETLKNGKGRRRYISSCVVEPAYEIIKKYGIDKWKEYENISSGMCGGSVSVRYRDGDEIVGSSLDHMGSAVADAYHELFALFAG